MTGPASFHRALGSLKARSSVFKALGHPTRLFIVEELSRGERCVCELTAMIGADISTVSKHLALLKAAGLVDDDKRGAQVFYRLRVPCVINSFGCIDAVLSRSTATATADDATPRPNVELSTLVSR